MNARIHILGVAIDDLTEQEALDRITGFIATGGPHQIVTVNPEFVVEARRNPAFRAVLAQADLATPDGTGLLVAARWRRTPLRARVTGIALTRQLAALAAQHGWSIFLLGAADGVAEQAAHILLHANPGLQIAGTYAGSPHPDEEARICALIEAARPVLLLVAYGHPRQDFWIARNQPRIQVPVAIGVGGTFDEIVGVVRPAPAWIQRIGLKWLYRLIQQPQRWRRIIDAVPVFLWHVLWDR